MKKSQSGLKLINLHLKDRALKVSWVKWLNEDIMLMELAYKRLNPTLRENIWACNLHEDDIKKIWKYENFWLDILKSWSKIHYCENIDMPELIQQQIIWLNSHVHMNGKPTIFNKVCKSGLMYIGQLLNQNGNFLTFNELSSYFPIDIMQYNSLLSAIPSHWRKAL